MSPRDLRSESGISLVEVLVAIMLVTLGLLAVGASMLAAKRSTAATQHRAVAVHQAQIALEQMRATRYDQLAHPTGATPQNPPNDFYANRVGPINGTLFTVVRANPLQAEIVVFSSTGTVAPYSTFNVNQVSGKIYRYVSWRGSCGQQSCAGSTSTKRITVAVSLDPVGTQPQPKPIVLSSVVAPGPDGATPATPVDDQHTVSKPQLFYLYDKACDANSWTSTSAATTAHVAHDTGAVSSTDPAQSSSCWSDFKQDGNPRRIDLMGTRAPLGTSGGSLPGALPPRMSNEWPYASFMYPGGLLVTTHNTATCTQTTYPSGADGKTIQTDRNNFHRWVTGPFTKPFQLNGEVSFNMRTHLMGTSNAQDGALCITVFRHHEQANAQSTDTVLASGKCGPQSDWPQRDITGMTPSDLVPPRLWNCSMFVQNATVPAGDRIGLAVSVPADSSNQVMLFYDDPDTPASLRVTTTTPCEAGGPCPVS